MQMKSFGKRVAGVCGLLLVMFLMTGCMSTVNNMFGRSGTATPPENAGLEAVTTMVESYGDIELPMEMKLDSSKSIAMRTDSFQGGIHAYSGRVQIGSLREYVLASMRNQKWKLVGEASYKNVMLAFTKPNKTCMVVLSESVGGALGKTEAVFYVTVDVAAANQLAPFGAGVNQ